MTRARTPFPVPLSPVSNTVASSLATRFTCATRRRINAHSDASRADGGAGLRGRIDVTTLAAGLVYRIGVVHGVPPCQLGSIVG